MRRYVHLERRAAPAFHRHPRRLLQQGVPGRCALGHLGTAAGADVQAVRDDTGGVAGQGAPGQPAEGLRVHHLRVGEECEDVAAGVHQRLPEQKQLVLQDQLETDEGQRGEHWRQIFRIISFFHMFYQLGVLECMY